MLRFTSSSVARLRARALGGWAVFCALSTLACSDTQQPGARPSGDSSGSASVGGSSSGGSASTGGSASGGESGGSANAGSGGLTSGGSTAGGGGHAGGSASLGCDSSGLAWKTARKTYYTAYPDPNSEECIAYNGCTWAGQFAACSGKKPEAWVEAHNIVAAFPDFTSLKLHDLCLRSGDKTLVVTVLDTCADSDCDGCCTRNQGAADALIDLESYTNARWGVEDGQIEWADLGPTQGSGCD
jgi:hypothetical protein